MLINGFIPKGTICPFKEECGFAKGCHHQGIHHSVDFSCALARAFASLKKYERIQP